MTGAPGRLTTPRTGVGGGNRNHADTLARASMTRTTCSGRCPDSFGASFSAAC